MKLDHIDFEAVAKQWKTPFYLYDLDLARAHLKALQKHLPPAVDVLYAVKANPNLAVLAGFKGHVAGLDLSSIGELALAEKVGYGAEVMSFAGPGKRDSELERAVQAGIHLLSVESPRELERLIAIAERAGKRQAITVRINPESIENAFMMKMGGRPSQFGVAIEDVDPVIERAKAASAIDLRGIHIYAGTQCLDVDAAVKNIAQTLEIAAELAERHDLNPQVVNLGGGFGVPYFPGQEAMDVDALSRGVGSTIAAFAESNLRYRNARFILELGRYLIGMFGVYVTRVLDVKETRGARFVIMDGGMHHCFAATGNFGQLVKKNYPVVNLSRESEPSNCELVGPLCTPLDSMARKLPLGDVQVDDLICFNNCGAYAYTASPLLFLGHDTPVELVRSAGEVSEARPARPISDFC